jgi:hypothetical protein
VTNKDPLIQAARRTRKRREGRARRSRRLGARTALLTGAGLLAVVVAGWQVAARPPVTRSALPVTLTSSRALPDQGGNSSAPVRALRPQPSAAGQDRAEEQRATADARWRTGRPAYQALPWRGDGILIDIIGAAASGKVILAVAYTSTEAGARRSYQRFLSLHNDAGTGYVARYLTWAAYRRALCPDLDACRIAPLY